MPRAVLNMSLIQSTGLAELVLVQVGSGKLFSWNDDGNYVG